MVKGVFGFYCSSTSLGGLEMNVIRLAKWMKERDWQVVVYASENSPMAEYSSKLGISVKGIKRQRKYFDFIAAYKMKRRLNADGVKFLLTRDTRDLSILASIKFLMGKKLVTIYQQAMQLGVDKKDVLHTLRYKKIDIWIAPLESLADQVRTKTNFPIERIKVIPLAMELDKYVSSLSKEKARAEFSLPNDKVLIGTVGRIDRQKGQLSVIKAFLKDASNHDAHLVIVGDLTQNEAEAYNQEIITTINSSGFEDRISILPFQDSIEILYKALDVFVMASMAETFGMVTIEAMASGVAVIGTNSGGTPELLGKGDLGLLYEPENIHELADRIKTLLDSPDLREKLGKKAQAYAIDTYSHHSECEQIEGVLAKF